MDRKYILLSGTVLLAAAIIAGSVLLASMRQVETLEASPSPAIVASFEPLSSPMVSPSPIFSPVPEETQSDLDLITAALAGKYNKPVEDAEVTIEENTGTHAKGGVRFAGEISGGWWLAYHDEDGWQIVADGNGTVMCADIEGYNFPTSLVPECWDEDTMTLIQL